MTARVLREGPADAVAGAASARAEHPTAAHAKAIHPRAAYPRTVRLSGKKAIDRVFQSGQYRRLGMLHAKWLPGSQPESRFLVSVKRKIGKAHRRHRIRRLVKEAIRLNRHRLQGAYDICLFLTAVPEQPTLSDFEAELSRLFQHLSHPHA
jgi:ribonuclease P protein component